VRDVTARARLRMAIDVASSTLLDRITAALSNLEDIELVGKDSEAEVMVVAVDAAAHEGKAEVQLTARELEVLALLAEGASNKLIARRLGISAHTAKYHVASLLEKLDAVSRTDVVASAARIGVLQL
jgi:DNA-binding CsgD family transcriptional regulator